MEAVGIIDNVHDWRQRCPRTGRCSMGTAIHGLQMLHGKRSLGQIERSVRSSKVDLTHDKEKESQTALT